MKRTLFFLLSMFPLISVAGPFLICNPYPPTRSAAIGVCCDYHGHRRTDSHTSD